MRVPAATLKRLAAVEGAMFGDDGKARGGVMLVPPIMAADAWEALAMPTLAKLAASAAEDIERHHADVTMPPRQELPATSAKGPCAQAPARHSQKEGRGARDKVGMLICR